MFPKGSSLPDITRCTHHTAIKETPMSATGLFTQTAASVLEDLDEFYFGYCPWFHGTKLVEDGTRIQVTMTDLDEDEGDNEIVKVYELSAQNIKDAFTEAKQGRFHLCCASEIENEQLGYGCAQDLNIIVQTACYGKVELA